MWGVPLMGMLVGGSKNGPVSDPNIVPLIDVLLVLIIIFMVITPTVPIGLRAVIPEPAPPKPTPEIPNPDIVVVQVMRDDKLMVNREPTDWDLLGARLSAIFKRRAEKVAFVAGADDIPFGEVARAIDIMRAAGIDHVALITPNGMPGA